MPIVGSELLWHICGWQVVGGRCARLPDSYSCCSSSWATPVSAPATTVSQALEAWASRALAASKQAQTNQDHGRLFGAMARPSASEPASVNASVIP